MAVAVFSVASQRLTGRLQYGDMASLTELAVANRRDPVAKAGTVSVPVQWLAGPHAGNRQQRRQPGMGCRRCGSR